MNDYTYKIRSAWLGNQEAPSEIGLKFIKTLDALGAVDHIFNDWGVGDNVEMVGIPLHDVRANITPLVVHNVRRDDYDDLDPDNGYRMFAVNSSDPEAPSTSKSISFSLSAGSKWKNSAKIEAGNFKTPPDLSIVTYPIFKGAILTMISIWPCPWANAYAYKQGYWKTSSAPGVPPLPYNGFHLAWIGYLSEAQAINVNPPLEIVTERTPDGGLLMSAAEERLDPTNPEHMKRSRILAEIMTAHAGDLAP